MMKKVFDGCLIIAVISLILGIVSRILLKPFPFGLEAQAYLRFTQTLLLFAIAIGIKEFRAKSKE
ncbi:MAG: hypothetical protein MUP52_01660 [Candidatus Aminicenantes bacterium]|jgi:hypothetical protein|nr:hypothetical protein [Candidatus Aminicenantes bacterium]